MKGSKWILALTMVAVFLAASPVWAQDQYSMPLDKIITTGRTPVKFQNIAYEFAVQGTYSVRFERVDSSHVRLFVRLIKPEVQPHVSIQWGTFQQADLGSPGPEGDTFVINSETGYAEK
jgi:hypothetical protein